MTVRCVVMHLVWLASGCVFWSAVGLALAPGTGVELETYTSRQGAFSAQYPSSWHVLPPPGAMLDIVSFPLSRRVAGSIIPSGGARLVLLNRPDSISDVEAWIRFNASGNERLSRSVVVLRRVSTGEELSATDVISEWSDGEMRYENVDCYFDISGHLFDGRLTYWRSDSKAPAYRKVLHGIVESVVIADAQGH
jgi:hypothetical protein